MTGRHPFLHESASKLAFLSIRLFDYFASAIVQIASAIQAWALATVINPDNKETLNAA